MRCLIFLLILACLFSPGSVSAGEVVLGRILAVDPDEGTVQVRLFGKGAASGGTAASERTEDSCDMTVSLPRDASFADFVPGDLIRIWADQDPSSGILRADAIRRVDSVGGRTDPTGVRRRLGKGWDPSSGHRGGGRGGH